MNLNTSFCCHASFQGASSFLTLINTLVAGNCLLSSEYLYRKHYNFANFREPFDYIVVGGGASGAAVANRLSENPSKRVLLIEAGDYPSSSTYIPGVLLPTYLDSQEVWSKEVEPTRICLGMTNGKCVSMGGKVLGGGTSINGMVYIPGNKQDFNEWVEEGNPNWNWETVLKYYKKSQNIEVAELKSTENYGIGGYLTLTRPTPNPLLRNLIFETAGEMNQTIQTIPSLMGYFDALQIIENGTRCSTAKAFISKIKDRQNLFILTETTVDKVTFTKRGKIANGVIVHSKQFASFNIRAREEIILSAGAIGTPKILFKSGIGPIENLAPLGIKLIQNLPVGKNLQDHIMQEGLLFAFDAKDLFMPEDHIQDLFDFFAKRRGALTNIGLGNLVGYINTKKSEANYPNYQFQHSIYNKNSSYLTEFLSFLRYTPENIEKIRKINQEKAVLYFNSFLLKPKSRGYIKLGKDGELIIQPNHLQEEEDIVTIIEANQYILKLLETTHMKNRNAIFIDLGVCTEHGKINWICFAKQYGISGFHYVGSCKMASRDKEGVVDNELRVYGVKNLRVADASIMPTITSANTMATCIMIGERVADFIKGLN